MKHAMKRLWHALCLAVIAFRVELRGWTTTSWSLYREPRTGVGDCLASVNHHNWATSIEPPAWGWRVSSGPFTYGVSYRSPLTAIRAAERRLERRARKAQPS